MLHQISIRSTLPFAVLGAHSALATVQLWSRARPAVRAKSVDAWHCLRARPNGPGLPPDRGSPLHLDTRMERRNRASRADEAEVGLMHTFALCHQQTNRWRLKSVKRVVRKRRREISDTAPRLQ
jgi:hypothetical protein